MPAGNYILRRLLLIPVTFIGITMVTFVVINLAPGGPIEQVVQKLRFGSTQKSSISNTGAGRSLISKEVLATLQKQYGFDQPLWKRYLIWLKKISTGDFGDSFVYGRPVIEVIKSRLPVSLQFGIVSFIGTYLISVLLGMIMARKAGSVTDQGLRISLMASAAIPSFVLAVLLLTFFASDRFFNWFPLGYLTSENYAELSFFGKVWDRIHHFTLPLIAYMSASFTGLAFLTRNSILQEKDKDYVRTAIAFGHSSSRIFWKYILRNALIPICTGIGGFLSVFLAGSLLVESIFQLYGIGLLGYTSILTRDYNVIMALAFLQAVAMLIGNFVNDLIYVLVDPRVDLTGGA